MTHAHTRDVGDGVQGAGGERADDDANLSRPGARGLGEGRCGGEAQEQNCAECGVRGAESKAGVVTHEAHRYTPHSACRTPHLSCSVALFATAS